MKSRKAAGPPGLDQVGINMIADIVNQIKVKELFRQN